MRETRIPLATAVAAGAALLAATGVAGAVSASPGWRPVSVPQPTELAAHQLVGVSCPTATFCMAVGDSLAEDESVLAVERWNGHAWALLHAPTVGARSAFSGVACRSADDCTLVGTGGPIGQHHPLIEHWDGTGWLVEATADPTGSAVLSSVSCPTATTCVTVGVRGASFDIRLQRFSGMAGGSSPRPSIPSLRPSLPASAASRSTTASPPVPEAPRSRTGTTW